MAKVIISGFQQRGRLGDHGGLLFSQQLAEEAPFPFRGRVLRGDGDLRVFVLSPSLNSSTSPTIATWFSCR